MTKSKSFLLAVICAFAFSSPAFAKSWTTDYANSRIGFTGTQGSASFDGGFKKFQVSIDFDPDKPDSGKITAAIDMASAFAGSEERDSALPQSDWFDTSKFPQAQFEATKFRSTGTDKAGAKCFEAAGTLTIKSISKPVTLPFCLKQENDLMRAQGKVTLARSDFGIGKGQWADESFVKYKVDVTIDIAARPAS